MGNANPTVVLVEGESDRQALLTLARRLGVTVGHTPPSAGAAPDGLHIVAMGGATSVDHFVRRYGPKGLDLDIVGMCDAREVGFFERALGTAEFSVCDADLEDELIRAAGSENMVAFIDSMNELDSFIRFQKQPAQRDRSIDQHLRRFVGTKGGRKIRYAARMIDWLPLDAVPAPLHRVFQLI